MQRRKRMPPVPASCCPVGAQVVSYLAMQQLTQTYLAELLQEAAEAHRAYAEAELGTARDEQWAQWYAGYMLDRMAGVPKDESNSAHG